MEKDNCTKEINIKIAVRSSRKTASRFAARARVRIARSEGCEKSACSELRPKRDVLTKQQSLSLSDIGKRYAMRNLLINTRAQPRIVEIQKYVARKCDASTIDY